VSCYRKPHCAVGVAHMLVAARGNGHYSVRSAIVQHYTVVYVTARCCSVLNSVALAQPPTHVHCDYCYLLLQVLSLHVDEVTIAKPSGSVKTQLAVYHLQVDDMRSKTSMPVVLQPTDSGTCQAPLYAQHRAIRVLSQCCIIYMLQCMTTSSGSSQHCECASCALTRACTSLRKHAMQLQSTQPDHSNL
jgi:hypothetical protein